ncbi:TraX family protein [Tepidimicrobium xylanilyticum]|uniref:TraX protein n=1 Tax=Tepidimicrobium xylanilyticum TaxID=1123352 RepID=A0A1H2XAM4_9FIRM|nr:TraX family protein [Tepidimicrobium xylanilyticum]GMG97446.1 fimbrial assembly protein fimC [Tepidimicrobium xylanilyticum]SDW89808.1 TraX protein [Tepidimicrobium xylanilyticum]
MGTKKEIAIPSGLKLLSSNELKTIAITCMVIQHAMYSGLIKNYFNLPEAIGTITMPIITFLLVEGYMHTRNVYRYFFRLIIFMLISELPYRLIFPMMPQEEFYVGNIMATLALTLVAIYLFDRVKNILFLIGFSFISIIILANILSVDYGFYSIILAFNFFFFRDNSIIKLIIFYLVYITRYSNFIIGLIIVCLLAMYNDNITNKKKFSLKQKYIYKYGYYLFYPLHFIALYLVKLSRCLVK